MLEYEKVEVDHLLAESSGSEDEAEVKDARFSSRRAIPRQRKWLWTVLGLLVGLLSLSLLAAFSIRSALQYRPAVDRITLLTTWNGEGLPKKPYLDAFFWSFGKQADHFDLIVIDFPGDNGRCLDPTKLQLPSNVQIRCVTRSEQHERLVRVLCDARHGWDCSPAERQQVGDHAKDVLRADGAFKNVALKPFNGLIFEDLIPTSHWGWIDTDTIIGDISRMTPWELLPEFDFVTFNNDPVAPIFMYGQLAYMRMEGIRRNWKKVPQFASVEAFMRFTGQGVDEEGFWSVQLTTPESAAEKTFDWLVIGRGRSDHIGTAPRHAAGYGRAMHSTRGTTISNQRNILRRPLARLPAFTSQGIEAPMKLNQTGIAASQYFFDISHMRSETQDPHACRIYHMRKAGKYIERREPFRDEVEKFYWLNEQAFAHWLLTKYSDWFDMPPRALIENAEEPMFVIGQNSLRLYDVDDETALFETGRVDWDGF